MCEGKIIAEDNTKSDKIAENHGSSAVQSSITKSYAIEILKETHHIKHIINIKIMHILVLNKRNLTLQK